LDNFLQGLDPLICEYLLKDYPVNSTHKLKSTQKFVYLNIHDLTPNTHQAIYSISISTGKYTKNWTIQEGKMIKYIWIMSWSMNNTCKGKLLTKKWINE